MKIVCWCWFTVASCIMFAVFLNKTFCTFALKSEHVRFLQDFIIWPKWLRPDRPDQKILFLLSKMQCLNFFSVDFRSCLVNPAENLSNACWRPCWEDPRMQYQFTRKTQSAHPAVPNSDTFTDASVTVYPSYVQPAAACCQVEGFVRPSSGFRCGKSIPYTDNLSLLW